MQDIKMQNYTVTEQGDKFSVKEVITNQVIKVFEQATQAQKLAKHLDQGGGFDSNTPSFFLKTFVS